MLAGLALAGMGAADIVTRDGLRSVGGLLDLILAGLLWCAALLFRDEEGLLRYVVLVLSLTLLAKSSVFLLTAAAGYARPLTAGVVLFYAGNLALGLAGVAFTRLHACSRGAQSP